LLLFYRVIRAIRVKEMEKDMIIPEPLKEGDKVGIAAPAGPFKTDRFEKGLAVIKAMGFVPVVDEAVFAQERHLAGSDKHRAGLINRLFADDAIKAIFCARGGFGCLRMLPYLDYELIREHPKILIGFSDITALLVTLMQRCGLAGLHAPVVTSLAVADEESKARLKQVLTAGGPVDLSPADPIVVKKGRVGGIVTGGNLATLCHLVGTDYAPDFSGKIVLLEDVNEAPYRIDRMLTQMRLAGCFDSMAGLVLGSFKDCGSIESILNVIEDLFADFSGPIMAGFRVGHGETNLAMPVGVEAELDTDEKILRIF
jgi:muramoyltetrapeptide carboxypeptidase